jgi:hypothetical protein
MTSNPEPIVPQLQDDFQNLLVSLTGPDARSQTASTVELTLFRRRLALGKVLLRLFFVTRAAVRPARPVTAPDGTPLTYDDQRPTIYYAVFGKVRCWRHSFTAAGQAGLCPLDAELSLPARCYADLRREWAAYGATDASYRESQTVLARILGLSLRLQAIEPAVVEAGGDVTPFYEQRAEPAAPPPEATILVIQADGQGVPIVQPPTQRPSVRLGKGQKRTKKQEAVVTGLYPIAPYPRTPQEVVAALLQDAEQPEPAARPGRGTPHPAPCGAHRGRRGAATAGGDPVSGAHRAPGHHPCHGVSGGHRHRPAGGDPSAAHGVGTRGPGGAAGGTDRPRHHGVGGRGERPHAHGDATAGGAAHGGLLPTQPALHAFR